MKTTDIITRAGRSLRQAKIRTLLTSLAIAVGAFTVSLALAAGAGGRAYVNQMVNTSGDAKSIMVYAPLEQGEETEQVLPEYGVIPEDAPDNDVLTKKDIADLAAIEGVAEVLPQIGFSTEYVVAPNGKRFLAPVAVKSDKTELIYAAGTLDDFTVKKGQIVMPESYIEQFGMQDATAAIGQEVTLRVVRETPAGAKEKTDRTLTVVAVDRASDTTIFYNPTLYVSPEDGEELYNFENAYSPNRDTYYGATVQVESGYNINDVKDAIQDQKYSAYSLQDSRQDLLQVVNIVQWGLAGFGALAIFASIFGIINTQYISVLERTQQIGLMKALGARQKDIGRLFRYEAAWVGFLGGVIGVGLALIVSLFNPLIATFVNLEEGMKLLIIEPMTSIALIGVLMLVAVSAGYFPSRKAARLDPIEALRTE